MPGPAPKHPSARARRNKASTNATLSVDIDMIVPELPAGDWHPMTAKWWQRFWTSPMAPELTESDVDGMYRVLKLAEAFWTTDDPKLAAVLQVRLEKAESNYGGNPMARRSLQWEIEKAEAAVEQGAKRRTKAEAGKAEPKGDPRAVLRAV